MFREVTPSLVGGDVRLTHVQEERARQDRDLEFDVQNDEEDTEKAVPVTHFQELTRIGHHGGRAQERPGHGDEALAKGDIFKDGPRASFAPAFIWEARRAGDRCCRHRRREWRTVTRCARFSTPQSLGSR